MNLKACRPENIEIVERKSLNSFNVKVKEIEFHGYAYRLWLSLKGHEEEMVNSEYISIDLSLDDMIKYQIKKGDSVSIRFK